MSKKYLSKINIDNTIYDLKDAEARSDISTKQDALTFDSAPTAGSSNPVTSSGIKSALDVKSDATNIDNGDASGSLTQTGLSYNQMILDFEPNMVAYISYIGAGVSSPTSEQIIALMHSNKTNPYVAAILGQYTFEQYCQGFLAGTGSIQPGVSNKTAIDALVTQQLTERWDISSSDDLSNIFGIAADGAFAAGFKNKVYSPAAVTFGFDNQAGDEGYPSESIGAIAVGYKTKALGNQSSIIAKQSQFTVSDYSGEQLEAAKRYRANRLQAKAYLQSEDSEAANLFPEDSSTDTLYSGTAYGEDSHVLGGSIAIGEGSVALNQNNVALGSNSQVAGNQNIALAPDGLTTGLQNYVYQGAQSAITGGGFNINTGRSSIVAGESNLNRGIGSIVGGYLCEEDGSQAIMQGLGLFSNKDYSGVFGRYNTFNYLVSYKTSYQTELPGSCVLFEIPVSGYHSIVSTVQLRVTFKTLPNKGGFNVVAGPADIPPTYQTWSNVFEDNIFTPPAFPIGFSSSDTYWIGISTRNQGNIVYEISKFEININNDGWQNIDLTSARAYNSEVATSKYIDYLLGIGNGTAENARSNAFEVLTDGRAKVATAPQENNDVVRRQELEATLLTYAQLKTLRDSAQLIPGKKYRITDYTATVANYDEARSAGHQFDIIVTADSSSTFNETASAAPHIGDTYFQYCDLGAWQLKYSFDNDDTRFDWADTENGKGIIYWLKDDNNNECSYDFKNIQFKRYYVIPGIRLGYTSAYSGTLYITTTFYRDEENDISDYYAYSVQVREGNQSITKTYYLDELEAEPALDCKVYEDVEGLIKAVDGVFLAYNFAYDISLDDYDGYCRYRGLSSSVIPANYGYKVDSTDFQWVYTFCYFDDSNYYFRDASVLPSSDSDRCWHDNIISAYANGTAYTLNNTTIVDYDGYGDATYQNFIAPNNHDNSFFGYSFCSNTITGEFYINTFCYDVNYNTIQGLFINNTIGYDFENNVVLEDFHNNVIGNDSSNNIFHQSFNNTTVSNDFHQNVIVSYTTHQTFSGRIQNSVLGNSSGLTALSYADTSEGSLDLTIAGTSLLESRYDGDVFDTNIYGGEGSLTLNQERYALRYGHIADNDYYGKFEMVPALYQNTDGDDVDGAIIHLVDRDADNNKAAELALGVYDEGTGNSYREAYLKTYDAENNVTAKLLLAEDRCYFGLTNKDTPPGDALSTGIKIEGNAINFVTRYNDTTHSYGEVYFGNAKVWGMDMSNIRGYSANATQVLQHDSNGDLIWVTVTN